MSSRKRKKEKQRKQKLDNITKEYETKLEKQDKKNI